MKTKITAMMVAAVMMYNMIFAGFAVAADDVILDVNNSSTNTANATGGHSDQDQNQGQEQDQKQKQKQNANANSTNIIRGNLPSVGFNGFITPGVAEKGEWKVLCSEMYMDWAADDIEEASYRKGFFEFITFDWGSNYEFTSMRKALPPNNNPVSCLSYWPGWESRKGDRPLGAIDIVGKVNTPDAAFVAQAYDVCKKEKGSSWVAIIKEDIKESVTSGASFNLSGALSRVTGGGESGGAVASGIGFAKARVKKEGSIAVKALCMGDQHSVITYTPPAQACDPSEFIAQIYAYVHEIVWCKFPCFNNQTLRFGKANAYMDQYFCEGRRNKQLLINAIYEYGVAERDYVNGRELTSTQKFGDKPKGVRTTTLPEARELSYKVHYNWALAVRELNGRDAEIKHAQQKGLKSMPAEYNDLKR